MEPEPALPSPRPSGPAGRVAVGLAVAALAAYLVAAILFVLPVEVPGVQDCGAPGAYLLTGRVDALIDLDGNARFPDGRVVELSSDQAEAARERPCQDRVAARALPAGGLVLAATLLGVAAFAVELFVVRPRRRAEVRATLGAAPPVPTGAAPPAD